MKLSCAKGLKKRRLLYAAAFCVLLLILVLAHHILYGFGAGRHGDARGGGAYYVETDPDNAGVNIGHMGVASGTKFELNFVYAMKEDPQSKFIQFKVTATVE